MAARSTRVILKNAAIFDGQKVRLRLADMQLSHGRWEVVPPDLIHASGTWASASDGFATGTQGAASYVIEDLDGTCRGDLSLSWDNPFVGTNSYTTQASPPGTTTTDGFILTYNDGNGEQAEVIFELIYGRWSDLGGPSTA